MKIPEHELTIEKLSMGWWCGWRANEEFPSYYLHQDGRWRDSTFNPREGICSYTGYFDTREKLETILYNLNPNSGPWHPKFKKEIPDE